MRVIVSGGFGALGRAVAARLAGKGHRLALIDRAPAPSGEAAANFAGCVLLGGTDLTDAAAAETAVARAEADLGGVEAVVNIAGGFVFETLAEGTVATLRRLFSMNLETCFNLTRAAAERLPSGGRIINIGAGAVGAGGVGMGPYTASKAGVIELTRCHAAELKARGITVNALLPSIIDTPANRADMPKADRSNWVSPAAIADVIAFLLSPASRAITGALIPVAGAE